MIVFTNIKGFYLIQQRVPQRTVVGRKQVVLDASPDLEEFAIRPGISLQLARRRCPGLLIVEYKVEAHLELFEHIWSTFSAFTPDVETLDLHQAYLDVRQDAHRYGGVERMLSTICAEVERRFAVKVEWGGGVDKWLAWLARGQNQIITPEMESLVLAKLPVENIALPQQVADRLHRFDIHTVAQLLNLPAGFLEHHLGFDRDFILQRLTRHKEPVRANFPPPHVAVSCDIDSFGEQVIERAVSNASAELLTRLTDARMTARALRLRFVLAKEHFAVEHKLLNTQLTQSRVERILYSHLQKKSYSLLQRIDIAAHGLYPTTASQYMLWGEQNKAPANEAIDRVLSRVQSRYGSNMLISGSESFAQQKPRFAQLVYRTRGISLY